MFSIEFGLSVCMGVGGGWVVVQWLDYLAVMQEPGVRFPAADECGI